MTIEGKRTVKDHGQPEVGDWVIAADGTVLIRVGKPHRWSDDREWLPASAVVIPDHYAPFPSSLSAVGWKPLAELEDGSDVAVWVLFKGGAVDRSRAMRREYDEDLGRVAWAPVIGAPPVPSDWSPDV